MRLQLRDGIRRFVPPWLSDRFQSGRTVGFRLLWTVGLVLDAMVEGAQQGTIARMPGLGTVTALPYVGRDRRIVRGFDETHEGYASRLQGWREAHQISGHAFAILEQIAGYLAGYPMLSRVVTNSGFWWSRNADGVFSWQRPTSPSNWDWDGESGWSRFWVILYPPASLWLPYPTYAAGSKKWGEGTWGTTATREQVDQIRALVQDWKHPSSQCNGIIIAFDPDSFNPTTPGGLGSGLPFGEWGNWSVGGNGTRTKARLDTARYWRGTV